MTPGYVNKIKRMAIEEQLYSAVIYRGAHDALERKDNLTAIKCQCEAAKASTEARLYLFIALGDEYAVAMGKALSI